MKKIKVIQSPRPFETVGEAVRFEVLSELKNKILDSRILSTDNSLTKSQLEYNRACVLAIDVIEKELNGDKVTYDNTNICLDCRDNISHGAILYPEGNCPKHKK